MNDKKVTIYDIAEKAGVSIGTVNRALNGKARISPTTKQRVLETAQALGYTANTAAQGLRRTPINLGAILFCPIDEYVDDIIEGMQASARSLEKYRVNVDIQKLPFTDSKSCLKETISLLRRYEEQQYNGVVLFMSSVLDELDELSAVIDELTSKSICIATVANDLSHTGRVVHVGIDAHMAGAMAAEMLALSCTGGEVALLVASKNTPVNTDYIQGFTQYAANGIFSDVSIYEHYDDKNQVPDVTAKMLEEHPNLRGVYMATASSVMACEYIKAHSTRNMTIITTDLLRRTPMLLRNKTARAVIFQNPYKQGKNVIRMLYHHITKQPDHTVQLIPPQILLSSNLDAYLYDEEL